MYGCNQPLRSGVRGRDRRLQRTREAPRGDVSLRFSINEKCTSCMACVRVCPVEAIAVAGIDVRVDEST